MFEVFYVEWCGIGVGFCHLGFLQSLFFVGWEV